MIVRVDEIAVRAELLCTRCLGFSTSLRLIVSIPVVITQNARIDTVLPTPKVQ